MLRNYLTIALRTLRRHGGYSFINIGGLAVGIASCLLITLYVLDELRFDRFHEHGDRIVRVVQSEQYDFTPTIVAPLLTRTFPEVEAAVRVYPFGGFNPVVVRVDDQMFQEEGFFYADSTVFDVFTFPFVAGDPATALQRPQTVVLTASTARRYFGDADPLGRSLEVGSGTTYEVTGVMEDVPANSHLQFDLLASFASTSWADQEIWSSANFFTYLRLRDPASAAALRAKMPALLDQFHAQTPPPIRPDYALTFQPLQDLYLHVQGRITYVYVFSAIALLILLIACVNYMNLATARAARRAREVGMRKVLGAHRGQLIAQFYGESALLAFTALLLAVVLTALLLPSFNAFSDKAIAASELMDPGLLLVLVGLGLVVSFVAGSYPALLLSSFQPVRVLKGTFKASPGGAYFRQGLVVLQFVVSIFLLAGTAVVFSQLRYVQTKNLGFDKEQVVVLSIGDRKAREALPAMKQALLQQPGVLHASAINNIPGYQRGGYGLLAEGIELPPGEFFPIGGTPSDADVVETFGLEIVAGTDFPKSDGYVPENGQYYYLVNEATLRETGWTTEEAVGRRIGLSDGRMGTLLGVVKDYHFLSLHEEIYPMAFFVEPWAVNRLALKLAPGDVSGRLAAIRETWERFVPHRPFEYTFLDQQLDALYEADQRTGRVVGAFSILAILVSCLGLFGLSAFTAEQRTKEIGVRKVLGASVPSIVALLSKDFVRLVAVAFILAAPLAFLVTRRWLENFAYRVELSWTVFVLAGLAALAVALLTVSYQSVKAALADPVRSLRYE